MHKGQIHQETDLRHTFCTINSSIKIKSIKTSSNTTLFITRSHEAHSLKLNNTSTRLHNIYIQLFTISQQKMINNGPHTPKRSRVTFTNSCKLCFGLTNMKSRGQQFLNWSKSQYSRA